MTALLARKTFGARTTLHSGRGGANGVDVSLLFAA